jgi:hypothetical protein
MRAPHMSRSLFRWMMGAPTLALLAAAWGGAMPARAACPTRPVWPTQGWPDARAEVAAARAVEIRALEDYAFTLQGGTRSARACARMGC